MLHARHDVRKQSGTGLEKHAVDKPISFREASRFGFLLTTTVKIT